VTLWPQVTHLGYVTFHTFTCCMWASRGALPFILLLLVDYARMNVGRCRTSSGDASLLLSPMRLASLQQLCRIAIRRLLSRDEVDHLVFMPPPIRRYLQYDRQPVSACGWVYIETVLLLAQLSGHSQRVQTTDMPVLPLRPRQQF